MGIKSFARGRDTLKEGGRGDTIGKGNVDLVAIFADFFFCCRTGRLLGSLVILLQFACKKETIFRVNSRQM